MAVHLADKMLKEAHTIFFWGGSIDGFGTKMRLGYINEVHLLNREHFSCICSCHIEVWDVFFLERYPVPSKQTKTHPPKQSRPFNCKLEPRIGKSPLAHHFFRVKCHDKMRPTKRPTKIPPWMSLIPLAPLIFS